MDSAEWVFWLYVALFAALALMVMFASDKSDDDDGYWP